MSRQYNVKWSVFHGFKYTPRCYCTKVCCLFFTERCVITLYDVHQIRYVFLWPHFPPVTFNNTTFFGRRMLVCHCACHFCSDKEAFTPSSSLHVPKLRPHWFIIQVQQETQPRPTDRQLSFDWCY